MRRHLNSRPFVLSPSASARLGVATSTILFAATLSACGDDGGSDSNVDSGSGDTGGDDVAVGDTTGTDAGNTDASGTDTSGTDTAGSDAVGTDTSDPGDTVATDTTDAADTSTSGDTDLADIDDVADEDTVEALPGRVGLIAWSGAGPGNFGAVNVHVAGSSTFNAVATWLSGSPAGAVFAGDNNVVGDIDGDGLDDLIAWSGAGPGNFGVVYVHRSTGSAFAAVETWFSGSPAGAVFSGANNRVGDVDGDGDADLIAWSGAGPGNFGVVNVHRSTGTAFGSAEAWLSGSPAGAVFSGTINLVGDIDGDGLDDLIAWSGAGPGNFGVINVHRSTGTAFGAAETWLSGSPAGAVFSGTNNLVGDIDGDGDADLIAWTGQREGNFGVINVHRSTGTAFGAAETWLSGSPAGAVFAGANNLAADIDGDGDTDLIAWSGQGAGNFGTIQVHRSTGTAFGPVETWLSGSPASAVFAGAINVAGVVAPPAL